MKCSFFCQLRFGHSFCRLPFFKKFTYGNNRTKWFCYPCYTLHSSRQPRQITIFLWHERAPMLSTMLYSMNFKDSSERGKNVNVCWNKIFKVHQRKHGKESRRIYSLRLCHYAWAHSYHFLKQNKKHKVWHTFVMLILKLVRTPQWFFFVPGENIESLGIGFFWTHIFQS